MPDQEINGDLVIHGNLKIEGPSPWADVTAFGAKATGQQSDAPANDVAIRDAIRHISSVNYPGRRSAPEQGGGVLFFPPGVFWINDPIEFPSNFTIQGTGPKITQVHCNGHQTLRSRELPKAAGSVTMRDIGFFGRQTPDYPQNPTVGINLTNVNATLLNNVDVVGYDWGILIRGVDILPPGGGAPIKFYALYNELHGTNISAARVGLNIGDQGFETRVFGGRYSDVEVGIRLRGDTNSQIFGTAIEGTAAEGLQVGIECGAGTRTTKIIGCRIEHHIDFAGTGIGVFVSKDADYITVISPHMVAIGTPIHSEDGDDQPPHLYALGRIGSD